MSTFYNLPALGERVTLLTHFVVREDAQLLYGFLTQKERAAVRELIKISGVGPKLALSVLSGLNADELAQCVALQDAARLTKVRELAKNYRTPAARTQRQTRRCLAAGWRHTKQCRGGQRCTQCAVGVGLFRKGSAAGAQTAARGAESGRIDPTGVEGDGGQITSSSRSCGCCTSNEKRRPKSPFCIKQSSDQSLRRRVAAKPSRPKPSKPKVAGSGTSFGLITTFRPTPVVKLSQLVTPPGSVPDTRSDEMNVVGSNTTPKNSVSPDPGVELNAKVETSEVNASVSKRSMPPPSLSLTSKPTALTKLENPTSNWIRGALLRKPEIEEPVPEIVLPFPVWL